MLSFLRRRYQTRWKTYSLLIFLLTINSALIGAIPYYMEIFSRVGFSQRIQNAGFQANNILVSADQVLLTEFDTSEFDTSESPDSLPNRIDEIVETAVGDLHIYTQVILKSEHWYLDPEPSFPDQPSLLANVASRQDPVVLSLENIYGYEAFYTINEGSFPSPDVTRDDSLEWLQVVEAVYVYDAQDGGPDAQLGIEVGESFVVENITGGDLSREVSMAEEVLRINIERLSTPSNKVATKLKSLGVTVTGQDGKVLSAISIVEQLKESDAQSSDFITLFGRRSGPFIMNLISQDLEALAEVAAKLDNPDQTSVSDREKIRINVVGTATSDLGTNESPGTGEPPHFRFLVNPLAAEKLTRDYSNPSRYKYKRASLYAVDDIEGEYSAIEGRFPTRSINTNGEPDLRECGIGINAAKYLQKSVGDTLFITTDVAELNGISCQISGLLYKSDESSPTWMWGPGQSLEIEDEGSEIVVPVILRNDILTQVMADLYPNKRGKIAWNLGLDLDRAHNRKASGIAADVGNLELNLARILPGSTIVAGLRQMAVESEAQSGPAFSPILMSFFSLVTAISSVSLMSLGHLLKENSRDARTMKQRGFNLSRLVLMHVGEFLVLVPVVLIGSVLISAGIGIFFFSRLVDWNVEHWSTVLESALPYSLILSMTFCLLFSLIFLIVSYINYSALPLIKLRALPTGISGRIRTIGTIWLPGIIVSLVLTYGLKESLSSGNFTEFNLRRDILVYASPAVILFLLGSFGVMSSRVIYRIFYSVLARRSGYSPLFAAMTRLSRNVGLSGWPIFLTATIVGVISFTNVVSNDLEKHFSSLSESLVGSDVRVKGFRDIHNVNEYARTIERLDSVEVVSSLFVDNGSFINGKVGDFKVVALNPEGMGKAIGDGKNFRPDELTSVLGGKTAKKLLTSFDQTSAVVAIEGRLSGGTPPLRLSLMIRESYTGEIVQVEIGNLYSTDWITMRAELQSTSFTGPGRIEGVKVDLLSSLPGIEGGIDIRGINITSSGQEMDILAGEDGYLQWKPVPKGHELSLSKLSLKQEENGLANFLSYSFVKKNKGADSGIYLSGEDGSLSVLVSEGFMNAHGIANNDPLSISVLNRELEVVPIEGISEMPGVSDSAGGFLLANLDQFLTHINSWDKSDMGYVEPTDIIIKLRQDVSFDVTQLREHIPEGTKVITKSSSLAELSPFAVLQMKGWSTQLTLSLLTGLIIFAVFTFLHDLRDRTRSRGDIYVLSALGVNSGSLVRQKIYESSINSLLGIGLGIITGYMLSLIVLPAILGKLGLTREYLTLAGYQDYWVSLVSLALACVFIAISSAFFSTTLRFKKSPLSPYRFDDEG